MYKTSSLHQAAFLKTKNIPLISIEKKETRLIFVFENTPEIQLCLSAFHNNGLVGNQTFWQAIKDLKSLVWEHKNNS